MLQAAAPCTAQAASLSPSTARVCGVCVCLQLLVVQLEELQRDLEALDVSVTAEELKGALEDARHQALVGGAALHREGLAGTRLRSERVEVSGVGERGGARVTTRQRRRRGSTVTPAPGRTPSLSS